jgi:hypothetical protein
MMLHRIRHEIPRTIRVLRMAAIAGLVGASAVGSARAGQCSDLPVGTQEILINRPTMEPEDTPLVAQGLPPGAARACCFPERDRLR